MPTYLTRTATLAGISTLRVNATEQLPVNTVAIGLGGSTYGARIGLGEFYADAPDPSNCADFTDTPAAVSTVDRTAVNPLLVGQYGHVALGRNIITSYNFDNPSPGVAEATGSKTPIPSTSGATVETPFDLFTSAFASGNNQGVIPPMPILDGASVLSALVNYDGVLIPDASAGLACLIDPAGPSISLQYVWEGVDATTAGSGSSISARPKNSGLGNWLLFGGAFLGSLTRPLLIDANIGGTENGRYSITLDDPTWDAVWASSVDVKAVWPCNAGWFAVFNIGVVTTPTFIVLNEDCSEYRIYVVQSDDAASLAAITTVGWGASFSERIYIDNLNPPPFAARQIQITGAVGNPDLLIGSRLAASRLLPPYPPVLRLPCVPCAPLQMDGTKWAGRVA